MRIKFKEEVGIRIQQLVEELEKEGVMVFNKGQNIQTAEENLQYVGQRTPTIIKKFSAKIEFAIPERFIEVEME